MAVFLFELPAHLRGQLVQPPIVQQMGMQLVLVRGGQFHLQSGVQIFQCGFIRHDERSFQSAFKATHRMAELNPNRAIFPLTQRKRPCAQAAWGLGNDVHLPADP
ncbi:MAG: hypothetical protein R8G60_14050 [Roseovarius pacificus]|nr:hypothetical protein [Roseovarius pacificus]